MQNNSPLAVIFAPITDLSLDLVRELKSSGCAVTVVSNDPGWGSNLPGLTMSVRSTFAGIKVVPSYVICLDEKPDVVKEVLEVSRSSASKTLFVKSFVKLAKPLETDVHLMNATDLNVGVLCVGSPTSADEKLSGQFAYVCVMKDLNDGTRVSLPVSANFFPLETSELSSQIVKKLFTMSAFGKRTAILGSELSAKELINIVESIEPSFKFSTTQHPEFFRETVDEKEYVLQNQSELIKKIVRIPVESVDEKEPKFEIEKLDTSPKSTSESGGGVSKNTNSARRKYLTWGPLLALLMFVTLVVFLPISMLVVNYSMLLRAKENLLLRDFEKARWQLSRAEEFSDYSNSLILNYMKIPLVSNIAHSFDNVSNVLGGVSRSGLTALDIVDTGLLLMNKSSADEVYDLQGLSDQLTLDIDSLSRELGFLLSEMDKLSGVYSEYSNNIVDNQELVKLVDTLSQFRVIAKNLPTLLGSEAPVKYLVLFQNNLRPRATGGVINSYAIVTLSGGRVVDVSVSSVGSSDKFLAGFVDPPQPFVDYLGYDKWFLRDSNWDVDFTKSAEQAGWFIENEIEVKPNGVIAVDVYMLDSFFSEFGGLDFDFGDDVAQLTTETESGVKYLEENTMTETLVKFFDILLTFDETEYLNTLAFAKNMLEKKHLMVTHPKADVSSALRAFGIDGSIQITDCGTNCYFDLIGLIESDFSEGNIDIDRQVDLEIYLEEGLVKRKLTVKYSNNHVENSYEAYVRIVGAEDSGFSKALITGFGESEIDMDIVGIGERKEAGLYIKLLPGEVKTLDVSWESRSEIDFEDTGNYNLLWLKQPGLEVPVSMFVKVPGGVVFTDREVGMIKAGEFSYKTDEERDPGFIKLKFAPN